jgi:phosphatidylglycerophosphatase A
MSAKADRRRIRWDRVKSSPRALIALTGATFFGAGLLPRAPGTWGSLLALPLWGWLGDSSWTARAAAWGLLAAWGVWSARTFDEINGTEDNQNIVMDEATGVGIAAATAGSDWRLLLAAFLLFRIFDILKPWPVSVFDRWSHSAESKWGRAVGVMADDWVAGAQALALILLAQRYGWLPSS